MKHPNSFTRAAAFLSLLTCFILQPNKSDANVCGEGLSIPPFLSSGADPNLLLVLDNSGSMLDLGYGTTSIADECVDDSFDTSTIYAGLFDSTKWYKWKEGVPQWINGTTYSVGDEIYTEGAFYKAIAVNGSPSTGTGIGSDSEVTWAQIYEIAPWTHGNIYPAKSFVQYDNQLYYSAAGGTAYDPDASDGISIDDDTIGWVAVDSTWLDGEPYTTGDIVSDNAMLFKATTSGNASGTGVNDDTGVSWARLDEGYFEEGTSVEVLSSFASAAGVGYEQADLSVKITEVGGIQSGVSFFAASGNLLNWASASKFDIQKKILTGGKYEEGQQLLVSQGRGCSSRGFIKEVPVGAASVLTFSIRGAQQGEWIDTTDDTTRITILGVTDDGFVGSSNQQACKAALAEVALGPDASLGSLSQFVGDCLDYTGTNNVLAASNAAYNHSIKTCWTIVDRYYTTPSQLGNNSEIVNACENIYDNGVPSATIDPWDSGYMCYGVYNSNIPDARTPTGTGSDREGYVGRCWEPGTYPDGCKPVVCSDIDVPGDPRCFPDKLQYECSKSYNINKDTCNGTWTLILQQDPATTAVCNPSAMLPGTWTDDTNPNAVNECIQESLWDYCEKLKVPEVIDPTDLNTNNGYTYGMVGALINSGVISKFGTDRPLIVMKGYIKQALAPEGIIHEVADDLRIGAMAFNDNGAFFECQSAREYPIIDYCKDGLTDGAQLITPINNGDSVTGGAGAPTRHVDDLTVAINDIRATAWTPLAEAVYNALGYYGQKTERRLNTDDFTTAAEDATFEDPVQYWCQDNYILVITEGSSTADINPDVAAMVASISDDGTVPAGEEKECLNNDDERYLFGSTYLDDLTYFGQHADSVDLFATPTLPSSDGSSKDKQNITSYMVVSGLPRDNGSDDECNPATIMTNAAENGGTKLLTGEDPSQLEANLRTALSDILSRASSGSAASVISSSRSGGGGVYQAAFWPEISRGIGKDPLLWVGDVHALFIDENGFFWDDHSGNSYDTKGELWTEDTNGNGILDDGEDFYPLDANGNPTKNNVLDGDRRIVTFYNDATNTTQICFTSEVTISGVCDPSDYADTFVTTLELREFQDYIWSAHQQLDEISDISNNRGLIGGSNGTWDFTENRRYIFTWNDLDNDGIVDSDVYRDEGVDNDGDSIADREEILGFVPNMNNPVLNVTPALSPRNDLLLDFNVSTNDELNDLIEWLRGNDIYESDNGDGTFTPYDLSEDKNNNGVQDYIYRCRKYPDCDPTAVNSPSWRLADVIHSTPTLVSRPAEGYHYIYNDPDYTKFYEKYVERRHVIYFGSNDGMLHAVNGGFYLAGLNKFLPCRKDQRNASNECLAANPYDISSTHAYPALGDELWAYIPYNLQPHLSCLTDPSYNHKYFVDAPPRIIDVRIFPDDAIHPGGWGTILVGYMRFGGAPTPADETGLGTDNREFVSSYFILDITDPERPPTLIAEMTMTNDTEDYESDGTAEDKYTRLGYTTAMPTVVIMRNDAGDSEWFLIFGNGPTTVKGQNDQQGKVAIVDLNSLTGVNWTLNGGSYDSTTRKPFRVPNEKPTSTSSIANFGRLLIDPAIGGSDISFVGDMVTVDFDIKATSIKDVGVPYKSDVVYFGTVDGSDFYSDATTKPYWNGDGRLLRLVTKDLLGANQVFSYPEDWEIEKLLDAQGPITAAPNIGYDGNNFWVYFGTGRFYAPEDKTDESTQYFFGVKEPQDGGCNLTWGEIDWWSTGAGSAIATAPAASPGQQGLLRADPIRVIERGTSSLFNLEGDYVYCEDDSGTACTLPLTPLSSADGDADAAHTYYGFNKLERYIQGEKCYSDNTAIGIDGWYRQFNDPRERSLGMPTLLGGLATYTSYQPFADMCEAEGLSYLYGVYYLTGTAWYENVFGTYNRNSEGKTIVKDRLDLGKGQATTPSLHVGSGEHNDATAHIQTSTGELIEVGQKNLPINNTKSGRTSWRNR